MTAENARPIQSVKLVFLGDSGVGKTTMGNKYISGNSLEPKPTIGAAFLTKNLVYEGNEFQLFIWDTSGQEAYRGLAPMYYRSALIAIVVFDVTRLETFKSVDYWMEQLRINVGDKIVIMLVGNKLDLKDERTVDSSNAEELARKYHAMYIEISAKTGAGVDRVFQMCMSKYLGMNLQPTDKASILQEANEQSVKRQCC